ncbi:MAG: hypothetical protein JWO36_4038, partial [Myxococcales bacterium]|nr:hypothetical protein [Myxococcales bacterium]
EPDPAARAAGTWGAPAPDSRMSASSSESPPISSHPSEFRALRAPDSTEEPILPPAYSEAALRDAVGAKPRPPPKRRATTAPVDRFASDDDDDEPPKKHRSRRTIVVSAAAILGGLTIAGLVFLGRANSDRYLLVCATDHVSAEQGRSFPPWGSRTLTAPEWKPVALPPNAECKPRETDNPAELEQWYLEILQDRASTLLATHNLLESIPVIPAGAASSPPNPIDLAAEQLDQALLLTRAPERRKQRTEIERLLGDVEYWRAALKLRTATTTLVEAAKQFEVAAAKPPRHASDAAAWGSFVQRLADELHSGPSGIHAAGAAAQPTMDSHPAAPAGTALPVEPPAGSDASGTAMPGPDAGVAPGGVLL